ncbi:MAG: hypothetical protein HY057_06200 [Rhodospirillales bacterium]|nr:hypothetical protein [Rhodospirillales bacterium]
MTTIPAAGYFSNAGRTNAEAKQAQDDALAVMRELLGGEAETTLTIAAGAITPTRACHAVDTEMAAAADDLANIATTSHPDGRLLLIRCANAARVVTVKHNAGGAGQAALVGGLDFVLDNATKWLLLKRTGANWEEIVRSYGSDKTGARAFLGVVAASEIAAGVMRIANQAEVDAGVDDATAVSPKKARAGARWASAPRVAKAANYVVTAADRGAIIVPTVNGLTIDMGAGALGDNFIVGIQGDSPARTVTLDDSAAANNFYGAGLEAANTVTLSGRNATWWLSNGGSWWCLAAGAPDIPSLTEDAAPDLANDFLVAWDASAGLLKKVRPNKIGATAATQAQMEAASGSAVFATPGNMNWHPGVSKGWVSFNGDGTVAIAIGYDVMSVTDNGPGNYTINHATNFSTANYAMNGTGRRAAGDASNLLSVTLDKDNPPTVSATRIRTVDNNGIAVDPVQVCVAFYGDQ